MIMRESLRQVVHFVTGILIAGLVLVLGQASAAQVLAVVLLLGAVLVDLVLRGYTLPLITRLLGVLDRSGSLPGRGAFFLVISALVCIVIFPVPVVVPALVALSVLDSVATLVGKRFGKIRVYNGKSVEGTAAGMVVAAGFLLPVLTAPGALLAAIVAGITEMVVPVDDNLVIPPAVCVFLTLMPQFIR
jgi:dolichol kinase